MRISIRFLLLLLPTLTAVVLSFLWIMYGLERKWVSSDLHKRSRLVSDSIQDSIVDSMNRSRHGNLQKLLSRISRDSRLLGVVVCTTAGALVSKSEAVPKEVGCEGVSEIAAKDPDFFKIGESLLHRAVYPLHDHDEKVGGYVVILHDSSRNDRKRSYWISHPVSLQ